MFSFILLSLSLCILVETQSSLQAYLISANVHDVGFGLAIVCILGIITKRLPAHIGYDLFSSATLFIWFAGWKPVFKDDSPMFFAYPVYFVFIASLMAIYLIAQAEKIDKQTLQHMQLYLNKTVMLQPWLVMSLVLIALEWQDQYLLYPTCMTLLIVQSAFISCLNKKSGY